MSERGVPQIVAQPDRLCQHLIEPQGLSNGAADLRDFQNVRQARAVMIAFRCEEDLRLVLQPPERFAVNDAVAVALIRRPQIVFRLRPVAAARLRALRRAGNECVVLDFLQHLPDVHGCTARTRGAAAFGTTSSVTLWAGTSSVPGTARSLMRSIELVNMSWNRCALPAGAKF